MDKKLLKWWRMFKYYNPLFMVGAIVLVIFLAYADYRTVITLIYPYTGIGFATAEFYGVLIAICTKGSALFAGIALATWINAVLNKKSYSKYLRLSFFTSVFTMFASSAVIATMGWIIIHGKGGMAAFRSSSVTEYYDFPIDVFLSLVPILSTLIAMNVSWFAFRKINDTRIEFLSGETEKNSRTEGG